MLLGLFRNDVMVKLTSFCLFFFSSISPQPPTSPPPPPWRHLWTIPKPTSSVLFNLHLLMIVIQKRMPLMLLKDTESDTLYLRSVWSAVVSFRHQAFSVVVAALVLVVLLKCVAVWLWILLWFLLDIFRFACDCVGVVMCWRSVVMFLLAFAAVMLCGLWKMFYWSTEN